uniref:Uncharacterized protein n=1 Tax=viral metagenome TaxID=1070528 RepID=A0A6C0EDH3_9ZZZZ
MSDFSKFIEINGSHICIFRNAIKQSPVYLLKYYASDQKQLLLEHVKLCNDENILIFLLRYRNASNYDTYVKQLEQFALSKNKYKISYESYALMLKVAKKLFGSMNVWVNNKYQILHDSKEQFNNLEIKEIQYPIVTIEEIEQQTIINNDIVLINNDLSIVNTFDELVIVNTFDELVIVNTTVDLTVINTNTDLVFIETSQIVHEPIVQPIDYKIVLYKPLEIILYSSFDWNVYRTTVVKDDTINLTEDKFHIDGINILSESSESEEHSPIVEKNPVKKSVKVVKLTKKKKDVKIVKLKKKKNNN